MFQKVTLLEVKPAGKCTVERECSQDLSRTVPILFLLTLITVVSPLLRVHVCSFSFFYNHKWYWESKVEFVWCPNVSLGYLDSEQSRTCSVSFLCQFSNTTKSSELKHFQMHNWSTHTHSYCQQVWNCYLKPEGGSTIKLGKLKL